MLGKVKKYLAKHRLSVYNLVNGTAEISAFGRGNAEKLF